jgi:probable F420-dependent oxidoreductase
MEIDVTQGRPSTKVDIDAADAEASGFDGFWVGETHRDPFLCADAAARATTRVTVGTAVAIAFARTPMTVAYTGYDLAQISGGRFVLGLGSQVKAHIERRFSMPWSRPAARMREYILALRAIWASWHEDQPLAFDGEFYQHTLMTPFFSPDRHEFGPPDVYLAAVGEAMTTVAGEVADGLVFHPFTTPRYLDEVTRPALDRGARKAGRDPVELALCGPVFTCVGRDERELAAAIAGSRQQLAFYASTPSYRGVLDLHGWGGLQPELTALSKEGRWDEMGALITDDVLAEFAVIGSPTEVAEELQRRWGPRTHRISLYTPYDVEPDALRDVVVALRS